MSEGGSTPETVNETTVPRMATSQRARQRGFTLVELLVVLGMVALMMTVAIPRFSRSTPGIEMEATVATLHDQLRLSRDAAISQNRESWLELDLSEGEYRRSDTTRPRKLPDGISLAMVVARRELTGEQRGRIRFFPDGTSTGGAIRLSRGNQSQELAVDWFDGRVTIHDFAAQ